MTTELPRRDHCYFLGQRAAMLNTAEATLAWQTLAQLLEALGDKDLVKYSDLYRAIRRATVHAKYNAWRDLPLPGGEGRGEGERSHRQSKITNPP